MKLLVVLDWKTVAALGAAICGTILATKLDPSAAERVSTHAVDACKECAVAANSSR